MRILKSSPITKTWATDAGHGPLTGTLTGLRGKLVQVEVVASEVAGDPDVVVTITRDDASGPPVFASGAKDDAATYLFPCESHKAVPDALFNPVWLVDQSLFVSIDPDADAGGVAQTLTVSVYVYLEVPD